MAKLTVSLGNPFLIFVWSMAMLSLGCAIGIHWHATPGIAFCAAAVGAIFMVLHDLGMGLLWFSVSAKMFSKAQKAKP